MNNFDTLFKSIITEYSNSSDVDKEKNDAKEEIANIEAAEAAEAKKAIDNKSDPAQAEKLKQAKAEEKSKLADAEMQEAEEIKKNAEELEKQTK